jgi:hypothetical protein
MCQNESLVYSGLKPRDKIALVIREANPRRRPLYGGVQQLKSGREIYGAKDVSKCLRENQRIRVEASLP